MTQDSLFSKDKVQAALKLRLAANHYAQAFNEYSRSQSAESLSAMQYHGQKLEEAAQFFARF